LYKAGEFVAGNQGKTGRELASVDVDIRATDPAGLDPHQHLALA
jgi:hypothetical protein